MNSDGSQGTGQKVLKTVTYEEKTKLQFKPAYRSILYDLIASVKHKKNLAIYYKTNYAYNARLFGLTQNL